MINKLIGFVTKKFLTGDFIAGKIRHLLTAGGGLLIGYQVAGVEETQGLIDALMQILDKPELWEGLVLYIAGYGGSVVNKVSK